MTERVSPDLVVEPDEGYDPHEVEPIAPSQSVPEESAGTGSDSTTVFEILWDLVDAERHATDSGKWYGTWDDTWAQNTLLQQTRQEWASMSQSALLDIIEQFEMDVQNHLYVCPLIDASPPEPPSPPSPPTLGPLTCASVQELRDRALSLRTPEGAHRSLPGVANEALARLWEAHANLGELLWDEDGGVLIDATGMPGCSDT